MLDSQFKAIEKKMNEVEKDKKKKKKTEAQIFEINKKKRKTIKKNTAYVAKKN